MTGDILSWVRCWTPIGGRIEIAPTGHQRDRGAAGVQDAWAVRKDGRYAVVWVSGGTLYGRRATRRAEDPREPMLDRSAISRVAKWGSRADACAELDGVA